MKTILILGANGGIGKATARAFLAAGWRVAGLVRGEQGAIEGIKPVRADMFDTQAVVRAVSEAVGSVDVVFNGLNVPYPTWPTDALPLYTAAADIAEALGARHIYPGSVYNFGSAMPPVLTPQTPFRADTVKARIRVEIEAMLRQRAQAGRLKTLIIRAGDFFGAEARMSWMKALVGKDLAKGKIVTPGKPGTVHAWAYLPDLAQVIVRLAEKETELADYEVFHFESHNVTPRQLAEAGGKAAQRKVRVSHMPRMMFSLIAVFDPFMKAALEMLYLWDVPHALKDDRLKQVIGDVPKTSLDVALKSML
ncbi:MAG: SDR family NAD(P)-dependent oxidoreductase [Asticcacaulis sp.]